MSDLHRAESLAVNESAQERPVLGPACYGVGHFGWVHLDESSPHGALGAETAPNVGSQ